MFPIKILIINGFSLFLVVSQRRNIYLFVFNFVTSISMLMLVIKLNHAELISPDDRHNRNLNHYQYFKYLLLSTFCNECVRFYIVLHTGSLSMEKRWQWE